VSAKRKARPVSAEKGLAAEPVHAQRFEVARSARLSAMLEDYTELISDLLAEHGEARTTEIARHLGVAHPTATKTIARLKREGLATSRPYRGVFLTEAGHAMAARARSRHRLVVEVLLAIGVPPDAAEADAEGIEHYVSDATLGAFERFLRRHRGQDARLTLEPGRR
jgi:DtxR family manganese transport transcriptional regulator